MIVSFLMVGVHAQHIYCDLHLRRLQIVTLDPNSSGNIRKGIRHFGKQMTNLEIGHAVYLVNHIGLNLCTC